MLEGMLMEIVAVTRGLPREEGALWKRYCERMGGVLGVKAVKTERDAEKILEPKERRGWWIVVMDERGEDVGSRELAEKLMRAREVYGVRGVRFVVGGADGLSERWRRDADWCWRLGRVTWPHHLMQVMLAEQLYRVKSITEGHPYHRD